MEIQLNDVLVNYERVGSGKPVIVMHGWGQNLEMMYSIVAGLKDEYEVFNVDLPGFGQSDEPPYPYTIDDYADLLEEFIKANNIEMPIIIGHSFGCRVAIKYASRANKVTKMVLTGAAGIQPKRSVLYYVSVYSYKFIKLFKNVPFVKHYIREAMDNRGSDDYRNSTGVMKEVLKNTVNEDLTPCLEKIKVPVLLVFGSKDDATPIWMGKIMEREMADAKLVIYENCSHYAYLEEQTRFNTDMINFLKEGVK